MSAGEAWDLSGQEPGWQQEHLETVMGGYDEGFRSYGGEHDETASEIDALARQAAELVQKIYEAHTRVQERYADMPARQPVAESTVRSLAALASAGRTGQASRVVREVSISGNLAEAEHAAADEVIRRLGGLAANVKNLVETDILDATLAAKTMATHGDEAQEHKARAIGLSRS